MIGKRYILVRKCGRANPIENEVLDKVRISQRSYDLLSNFIQFPDSADRWHPELRFEAGENERKLIRLTFYTWRMLQRSGEFSTVLAGCRHFKHFSVYQLCKREDERLVSFLQNRQSLRAAQLFKNCWETLEALWTLGCALFYEKWW